MSTTPLLLKHSTAEWNTLNYCPFLDAIKFRKTPSKLRCEQQHGRSFFMPKKGTRSHEDSRGGEAQAADSKAHGRVKRRRGGRRLQRRQPWPRHGLLQRNDAPTSLLRFPSNSQEDSARTPFALSSKPTSLLVLYKPTAFLVSVLYPHLLCSGHSGSCT